MLRQRLVKENNKRYLMISVSPEYWVKVASLGIASELRIEMQMDPKGEMIKNEKFVGYVLDKETEEWISTFLGRPTQFVRNYPDTVKELNPLMIH